MPSPTYTCGGCDNRWHGVSRAHCAACHRTFSGVELFDRHRHEVRGKGACLDPTTLTTGKARERVAFLTDGIWQGVEAPVKRMPPWLVQ